MANDLSGSTNAHLVSIRENVKVSNDGELLELYKLGRAEQVKKLKEIFTVIDDNDASSGEKAALEAKAALLLGKIDKLETKMAKLESEISAKEGDINAKAKEAANYMTQVESKSADMENKHYSFVKRVIDDVFAEYQRDPNSVGGKDGISLEIRNRIREGSTLSNDQAAIQKIIDKLDSNRSVIDEMMKEAAGWMDDVGILQREYGVTKSTYKLLNKTISQIGNTNTTYTNSDYDKNVPVYSLEKTDIISDLFDNEGFNVLSTNSNFDNGVKPITETDIAEKYSQYFSKNGGGGGVGYSNELQNLEKAINAGMLEDLKSSNMSAQQIARFFGTNFMGAGYSYTGDGLEFPYGHDADAQNVHSQVNNFIQEINKGDRYIPNTWDKDQGNTISSNEQIAALNDNYASIINQLANGEPPFTFKEAMYALFDQNNGLFKNSGILYDVTKQGSTPSYTIDRAGDAETQQMYKDIASAIKTAWGVDATWIDSTVGVNRTGNDDEGGEDGEGDGDDEGGEDDRPIITHRTDPLTFRSADSEYAIVIDRDENGAFSDTQEFVGATGDWKQDMLALIEKYDSDHDGKLTGEELKNIKMLKSTFKDNAGETRKEGKLHETKNNVDYEITNAFDMGIESISKEDIQNAIANERAQDVHGNDKVDANNSAVFTDSLTFKTKDGTDITFGRKDDTQEYMNAVYGDAEGKNFELGVSEAEADELIDEGYEDFDAFQDRHAETFQNINVLKNYGSAVDQTKLMFDKAKTRTAGHQRALLTRADNKAEALNDDGDWGSISSEVIRIANEQAISIDMEQAKGIYESDRTLDARGVVERFKQQDDEYNKLQRDKNDSKIAWNALIKCFKSGINTTADEVNKLIQDGHRDADKIVEILKAKYNTNVNADTDTNNT